MWTHQPVSFQAWSNKQTNSHMVKNYVRYVLDHAKADLVESCDIESKSRCLSEEMTTLNVDNKQIVKGIHPAFSEQMQCTVLLTHNLAQLQWFAINCNTKLLSHVMCQVQQIPELVLEIEPSSLSCSKDSIFVNNSCFHFVWQTKIDKSACKGSVMLPDLKQAENIFSLVFGGTGIQNTHILVGRYHTIQVVKHWMELSSKVDHLYDEGYLVCSSEPQSTNFSGLYFKVLNNTVTSSVLCENSDNISCPVELEISPRSSDGCSELHYLGIDGKCRGYLHQNVLNNKSKVVKYFNCSQKSIDEALVNDSYPDCEHNEDEQMPLHIIEKSCKTAGMLPCVEGYNKCFGVPDICVFRLDSSNHLYPCRTGSHTQRCEHFDCNAHYKCPGFYCIPWQYLCDGKIDCPHGYDESTGHRCGLSRACSNMFKCFKSQTCIHYQDICNVKVDCPFDDDELLCDLADSQCFSGCKCLFYAIVCNRVSLKNLKQNYLPFVSYSMTHCNLSSIFFHLHENALRTNFSHNRFLVVPKAVKHLRKLWSLDLSYNSLSKLERGNFKDMIRLYSISVKNNKIVSIGSETFRTQKHLFAVNAKNNMIQCVGKYVFNTEVTLPLLFISNNSLPKAVIAEFQSAQVSAQVLVTDSLALCCLASDSYTCLTRSPWYLTCQRLVQRRMAVFILCLVVFIFLFDISLLFANICSSISGKKLNPYHIILSTLPGSHLLANVYFILQFIADSKFGQEYIFHATVWKESFTCRISAYIIIIFTLLVPSFHSFLALSRMEVVIHPMDSAFKNPKFVSHCLGVIFVSCVIGAVLKSLAVMRPSVTGSLCLPFEDPTRSGWVIPLVTSITLTFQTGSLVFNTVCSVLLVKGLQRSQKNTGTSEQRQNVSIVSQLVSLAALHASAWIPRQVIFLVCLAVSRYPLNLPSWAALIGISVDTLGDPLLFLGVALKGRLKEKKPAERQAKWVAACIRNCFCVDTFAMILMAEAFSAESSHWALLEHIVSPKLEAQKAWTSSALMKFMSEVRGLSEWKRTSVVSCNVDRPKIFPLITFEDLHCLLNIRPLCHCLGSWWPQYFDPNMTVCLYSAKFTVTIDDGDATVLCSEISHHFMREPGQISSWHLQVIERGLWWWQSVSYNVQEMVFASKRRWQKWQRCRAAQSQTNSTHSFQCVHGASCSWHWLESNCEANCRWSAAVSWLCAPNSSRGFEHEEEGTQFIPRLLTDEQKRIRVDLCRENLHRCEDPLFLWSVITGDESWFSVLEPEQKVKSLQWITKREAQPKKAMRSRQACKTLMEVFFDDQGIVHLEFLPPKMTVTSNIYCRILACLREAIRCKRPSLWKDNRYHFLHDNAPGHKANHTVMTMMETNMSTVSHPPYSPDLAPADFWLFPYLKEQIRGHIFRSILELQDALMIIIQHTPTHLFHDCIHKKLPDRWCKCIASGGDYFEGDHVELPSDSALLESNSETDWTGFVLLKSQQFHWVTMNCACVMWCR